MPGFDAGGQQYQPQQDDFSMHSAYTGNHTHATGARYPDGPPPEYVPDESDR
jgi:hypothetical protein